MGREALRGLLIELEKLDACYPGRSPERATVARSRSVLPGGIAPSAAGRRRAPLDAAAARVGAGLTR